jgi:hypothetical protein
VAWAVWCALALYPVARRRALRALVAAYPLMTTLVVVATGNHFFLDTIAGALLAGAAWAGLTQTRRRIAARTPTNAAPLTTTSSPPGARSRPAVPRPRAGGTAARRTGLQLTGGCPRRRPCGGERS